MTAKDFLFELGTEELPPKALKSLSQALVKDIKASLKDLLGDALDEAIFKPYAAPRRLALLIENLADEIPEQSTEMSGPPTRIAYDGEGKPTKALEGFARKCGCSIDDLVEVNGKLTYNHVQPARPLAPELAEVINHALDRLPIPKRMRWGSSRNEFVRPVKWVVMLFGDDVVPAEIMGHKAGRITHGHRFHYNREIELTSPRQYADVLEKVGYVVADFEVRKTLIRNQLLAEAAKVNGHVQIADSLLEEVTALNEWPVALIGRFEERFLEVPPEALISTMVDHQKYFHVLDDDNKLMPYFITVANIESKEPKQVVEGNEKVIRPRFSDAAFFFETDKKRTLESRIDQLKTIVFQKDLGTVYEKSQRVSALAGDIAGKIGSNVDWASRAGLLCKTDLVTDMVVEFPELQGLMGYHYALNDGEAEEVAKAQNEHYMPRHQGDELPKTQTGMAVALADRLDTLVGLFGINQPPTGSKDPFALRRAALGTLRIIVENKLDLDIQELATLAASQYAELPAAATVATQVTDFLLERFRAWFEDEGVSVDNYLAVQAIRPTKPYDFARRVRAVAEFRKLPQAESLAAANKRVSNILGKLDAPVSGDVDASLLQEEAEKQLASLIATQAEKQAPLLSKGEYQEILSLLSALQEPVDKFFADVMVMCDDEKLRHNRLVLLSQLRELFLQIADISVLAS